MKRLQRCRRRKLNDPARGYHRHHGARDRRIEQQTKGTAMIVKIADAPIYIEANHIDLIRYDEERQTLAMFKMNTNKKQARETPFIHVLVKTETSPEWWKKNAKGLISDINKGKNTGKKCVLPITA
jgi:hypothetical protein